ncbi:MAG TPA: multicopper oxidase domain-containing protein, partial [Nocardioides sp.]
MSGSTRRQLFRSGRAALVAGAAGVVAGQAVESAAAPAAAATDGVLDLYVNEGLVRMVDDSLVYMRGFGAEPTDIGSPSPSLRIRPHVFLADGRLVASRSYPLDAPVPEEGRPDPAGPHPTVPGLSTIRREHWASSFPDRTIVAESGSTVRIRVHNRLSRPHTLRIDGVAATGPVTPGDTVALDFAAPPPGTYVYDDPGGGSVERMLGLHGVLLVVDPDARWRLGPGLAEFERQWLWLCQDVDPEWGERARAGEVIDPEETPP